MDYEKAYKEAFTKSKEFYELCKKCGAKDTKEFLENAFPELQESEDERIRKGIIDFLWKEKIFLQEAHSSVENNPKYRFVMDAIAWLEKQGQEPKKVPINDFKAKNWYVSEVDGKIHDMTYHRVQPKQEWSKDDERIVTALIEGFRYHQLFNPKFGEIPNAEIIDWLKSLKERLS